ncbi:uncharacterized protein LOC134839915 [Symsagittifera roscoffensis]|uniref:uncharacterized protein LOC134839915 n=1 Tax=Symsagittifera roscoffensis TaxID=84072 RepID=UPI00307BCEDE
MCYVDDVVISTPTLADHIDRLDEVFGCMKRAGLKCKPSECEYLRDSIKYLGRMVDRHGVRPEPETVEAVLTWKVPRTDSKLMSFPGFANYYHEFIKGYADKGLSKKTEFYERLEQKPANQVEIKERFSFLDKETYEALPLTRWLDKSRHSIPEHPELPVEKAAEIKITSKKDPDIEENRRVDQQDPGQESLSGETGVEENFQGGEQDLEDEFLSEEFRWMSRAHKIDPEEETCSVADSSIDDNSRSSGTDTYSDRSSSTGSELSELAIHTLLVETRASDLDIEVADQMGHQGIDKVYQRILKRIEWPGMKKACEKWLKACLSCQQVEDPRKL